MQGRTMARHSDHGRRRTVPKWVLAILVLLAAAHVSCEKVPLMSPDGSTSIFLQANPAFVIANGGRSIVTAVLTEPVGTFVPDGTVVYFFTTLGQIDTQAQTVNGIARATFVADSRSGPAVITAYSGGTAPAPPSPPTACDSTTGTPKPGKGNAAITMCIGSALPDRVIVGADPVRITSPRYSTITANVFDITGNPVQNVPVAFSIVTAAPPPLQETLASGGALQFTDSNGQAFDTLRTSAPAGGTQRQITVQAALPTSISAPSTGGGQGGGATAPAVTVFID